MTILLPICSLVTSTVGTSTPYIDATSLVASTTNQASINNIVSVVADSVNNTIYSVGGASIVRTGDSYTIANVMNTLSKTKEMLQHIIVTFSINVSNRRDLAPDTVFVDEILDPTGKVIHSEYWSIGNIYEREDVGASYSVFFPASSTHVIYTNTAQILVKNGRHSYESKIATGTLVINNPIQNLGSSAEAIVSTEIYSPVFRNIITSNDPSDTKIATSSQKETRIDEATTTLAGGEA